MLLKSQSNGSEIRQTAGATSSAACTQVVGHEIDDEPSKAIRLLQRAIAFLPASPAPAVLRAFDQLGIPPGLIADVLEIDRGTVMAWRRGQREIPEAHRVTLLAYLSVLLPWLYGAERHLTRNASALSFWQESTQAARHLLEVENRAAPLLARQARTLADHVDAVDRQAAARTVAESVQRPKRIFARRVARQATPPGDRSRRAG
jgi:hypothetical protein